MTVPSFTSKNKILDKLRAAHKNMYRRRLLKRLPSSTICAEIGVWAGDFSHVILDRSSPTELHLIDPWIYMPDREGPRYGQRLDGGQAFMDDLYERVTTRFASTPAITVHRQTSVEATSAFPNEYFDWIYLDADHSYESTQADIEAWLPKVKRGGFIAGDDYAVDGGWWGDGVVRAVDEAVSTRKVDNLYLTGSQFSVRRR